MTALPPITCPSCRKANDQDTEACSRCGCHLALLAATTAAAAFHRDLAHRHLLALNPGRAYHHALTSWNLKNSSHAARIASLACAAIHQFQDALLWHHRAHPPDTTPK